MQQSVTGFPGWDSNLLTNIQYTNSITTVHILHKVIKIHTLGPPSLGSHPRWGYRSDIKSWFVGTKLDMSNTIKRMLLIMQFNSDFINN